MEIYNLGKNQPQDAKNQKPSSLTDNDEPLSSSGPLSEDFSGFLVTELKPGVKNPNRVNVFVKAASSSANQDLSGIPAEHFRTHKTLNLASLKDSNLSPEKNPDSANRVTPNFKKKTTKKSFFAFSLDLAEVVDEKIKVGKKLSPEEFQRLKKLSSFGKFYQRALEWVLMRPRSEKETRDHLREFIYKKRTDEKFLCDQDDIEIIIEKLKSKHYLDDANFAKYYVENRFVKKGISARRLRLELAKKGIKKDIIEITLESTERNDVAEIQKIIAKKRSRYTDEKLTAYLVRQGFDYALVRDLVAQSSEMD